MGALLSGSKYECMNVNFAPTPPLSLLGDHNECTLYDMAKFSLIKKKLMLPKHLAKMITLM